ncbi:hypothetical protein SAMN04488105_107100 [Salipiger thiooxidans]|uniref:Carbon monoxide dehydrogenase subunit G n=1 Tax=Salipiger thiooxidans TaxID=282683 RepID=A0A1G7FJH6_9RHOB|nr:carbon monoxide dehydrogenase subunit G [Salipiger thiooxidans]SDE75745.1 hypothetical protein SAMN04488105_107100 [Salipiger thiooxidans]
MQLSEEYTLPAPRSEVWAALHDTDVLRDCIPGCTELEAEGDDTFHASVTTKIGPVKATFKGTVTMSEEQPPESFVLSGEGKGGVAGFAKGHARIFLDEHPEGTLLRYEVEVKLGGKLAQLGSRLIASTSRKLSAQFFDNFAARFETAEG